MKPQIQLWDLGERSEMGHVREENQDRMIAAEVPLGNLYVVADGMGGHKGGALAAALTVTGLRDQLAGLPADASGEEGIRAAFDATNKAVYDRSQSGDPATRGMGTTAVLLLAAAKTVRVAHAGDSRAYLYRRGRLRPLTADHTVVQGLLRVGALSPGEARNHPDSSVLDRAIGHLPDIEVDIAPPLAVEPGDAFLLCSDGLWGAVSDREIEGAIRDTENAQEVADRLVDLSLEKGGEDNITVQFIQYRGLDKSPAKPRQTTQAQVANGESSQAQKPVPGSLEDAIDQETVPAAPGPGSGSTRRVAVIATLSLAAAALVAGMLYLALKLAPPSGGETANDLPSGRTDLLAPQSAPMPSLPAPLATFRDALKDGSQGPEMVVIPAGKFQMGCVSGKGCQDDELPVRTVTFAEPFAIGKHEVTFTEYDQYAEATGKEKPADSGWGRGRRPVIGVSWEDATAYCGWLSEQTGRRYRLPTEAEWEYAARAGTETRWSFGDDEADLDTHGWYEGNANGQTHSMGGKLPSSWGLYDMHGNVYEWVRDAWHDSYRGAPADASGWESEAGADRVSRGGSWFSPARDCRSADRAGFPPEVRNVFLGFRCARVQD